MVTEDAHLSRTLRASTLSLAASLLFLATIAAALVGAASWLFTFGVGALAVATAVTGARSVHRSARGTNPSRDQLAQAALLTLILIAASAWMLADAFALVTTA